MLARYRELGDSRGAIQMPNGAGGVDVGIIELEPGNYVVSASLDIVNMAPTSGIAACLLVVGGRNAQAFDTIAALSAISQTLTVAADVPGAGAARARLVCNNNGFPADLRIQSFTMYAIRVGSLTFLN